MSIVVLQERAAYFERMLNWAGFEATSEGIFDIYGYRSLMCQEEYTQHIEDGKLSAGMVVNLLCASSDMFD